MKRIHYGKINLVLITLITMLALILIPAVGYTQWPFRGRSNTYSNNNSCSGGTCRYTPATNNVASTPKNQGQGQRQPAARNTTPAVNHSANPTATTTPRREVPKRLNSQARAKTLYNQPNPQAVIDAAEPGGNKQAHTMDMSGRAVAAVYVKNPGDTRSNMVYLTHNEAGDLHFNAQGRNESDEKLVTAVPMGESVNVQVGYLSAAATEKFYKTGEIDHEDMEWTDSYGTTRDEIINNYLNYNREKGFTSELEKLSSLGTSNGLPTAKLEAVAGNIESKLDRSFNGYGIAKKETTIVKETPLINLERLGLKSSSNSYIGYTYFHNNGAVTTVAFDPIAKRIVGNMHATDGINFKPLDSGSSAFKAIAGAIDYYNNPTP